MRSDVERALSDFEIKTFGNKKNIENAETMLTNDENVLFVTPTNLTVSSSNTRKREMVPGVVFLTDKRILFYYQALGNFVSDVVPLSEIHSVNCSGNGLTGSHVEVHTITRTYDILVTYKREIVQRIQQVFENARSNYKAPQNIQANQVNELQPDILGQIEKLSELKSKGILSDEEFQTKKSELLSRL